MKCGCGFFYNWEQIIKNPYNNNQNQRPRRDFSKEVIISNYYYDHTNGCNPNQQQFDFVCTRSRKYISEIPIKSYWYLCSLMKQNSRNLISRSTIQASLFPNFPKSQNITKYNVYHMQIRCKRLLKNW